MTAKKIAQFGLMTAMALVLSYVDRLFPLDFIAPGIRLGLSNTVLLYALYMMRPRDAVILMLLKVTLASLLFGFSQFPYSLAGGAVSLMGMMIVYRLKFSVITVSIVGGVLHNVGQIVVAALLTTTALLITYLPVLLFFGVVMGLSTGLVAKYVMRALVHSDKDLKKRVEGTDILPGNKDQKGRKA